MSATVETILLYTIGAGFLSIVYGFFTGKNILNQSAGNAKMQDIASAIQIGAKAYLARQYKTIAIVGVVVLVIVSVAFSPLVGLGYLVGATLSGIAGYVGMLVSVEANVRTAEASRKGLAQGLSVAFKSGAVTGMLVAGLALLAIAVYYYYLLKFNIDEREIVNALVALGFGASLISIFARLGGGIFTKGADVGADLVGKVEAGIPEDDPRNPAVIADNVGDNVGDCAGMAADLFETYAVTIVATMVLSSIFFQGDMNMMIYPLTIGGACILTSILGTFFVKLGKDKNVMNALYKGFVVSAIASIAILYPVTDHVLGFATEYNVNGKTFNGMSLYYCGIIGLIITGLLIWITEYYTGTNYRPVKSVAASSTTGHGTNVIQGLAVSMEATAVPALIIVAGILATNSIAGLYGIAIAVTTMLALAGMVVALDAYGPVTDNAGGIAEMSNLDKKVRKTTDALDAVGNTTKAVTKGFAIASAALAALAMIQAFQFEAAHVFAGVLDLDYSLTNPAIIVGLLIGGLIPFIITGQLINGVSRAAGKMVDEVRRQFKADSGILAGTSKPDYAKCVDIATVASIKEIWKPALVAIVSPIILGILLGPTAVAGLLMGAVVTGILLAYHLANTGGAWDNAKKLVEMNGEKGSEIHKVAVVGDIIGDPYKDTAGPALNTVIKLLNTIAIVFVSAFVAILAI